MESELFVRVFALFFVLLVCKVKRPLPELTFGTTDSSYRCCTAQPKSLSGFTKPTVLLRDSPHVSGVLCRGFCLCHLSLQRPLRVLPSELACGRANFGQSSCILRGETTKRLTDLSETDTTLEQSLQVARA